MTAPDTAPRLRDIRELDPDTRLAKAEEVRVAVDARLPELRYFNSAPCERHEPAGEPDPACRDCGIILRPHQRVGVLWFYLLYGERGGILADGVGTGKTAQAAGLLAMCKQTGELGEHNRAVIVCQAAAVLQWRRELSRFLPELSIVAVTGSMTRARRVDAYMTPWEILVISDRTFSSSRSRDGDVELLLQFPVGIVFADDIDALRTHKTQASKAIKALADRAARAYDLNAEPLQKRAMELHSHLEMVGGNQTFGSQYAYRRNFVKTGEDAFWQRAMSCDYPLPCANHESVTKGCKLCKTGHTWAQPARRCPECGRPGRVDPTGRTVRRTVSRDIGIKNAEEFRHLLRPWVLRRTEFGGAGYPDVQASEVWVELTPQQRERYAELRRDKRVRRYAEGGEVTLEQAKAIFTHGAQICSGTAALDNGATDYSAKLDKLMQMLTGSLEEDKVVAFVYFKPNVAALSRRLTEAGIGHVLMWGNETDADERDRRQQRFTEDPDCRVLVGTTTIERSLNLQAAGVLAAVDTVMNPKRMTQIVGRVRRRGSAHRMVRFLQFFARGTQEEGYLSVLQREQGISDSVWGESGDLYQGLSPRDMLRLVAEGQA